MSDDLYIKDVVIADGQSVFLDDEETLRLYNDSGVMKMQKYESGAWEDYQTWGE